jgi:hypothetical protein
VAAEGEKAAAAAAAAATAEEAARIEAEWNTPEAVAARAQAAATEALRARLAEVRQDWEGLVYSHRWSGRARREGTFNGHVAQLGRLAEETAAAEAAGAAGEALEEASAVLAEMEEAKRKMEAVAG